MYFCMYFCMYFTTVPQGAAFYLINLISVDLHKELRV